MWSSFCFTIAHLARTEVADIHFLSLFPHSLLMLANRFDDEKVGVTDGSQGKDVAKHKQKKPVRSNVPGFGEVIEGTRVQDT